MMKNQETASALIEMEKYRMWNNFLISLAIMGKEWRNFRRCPDYYGSGADFR